MANLSKTAASLRVIGDDLDPEEVTRLLGKKPDRARRRGEATQFEARESVARTGSWSVKTNSREPGDLDQQIGELLAGTTEDLATWRRVADSYRVDAFCGFFMKEGNEGITISPETLQKLGERGIALDLDIYAPPREHED
jgi:hypothetical protein